jgi:POT family proton-dependent oligopeptide transporter
MAVPAANVQHARVDYGFFGHPRGLSTLFFTEMWERFSFYGMRAFLILYMVAPVAQGGLGFADRDAASIYGTYTGSVWGAAIFGGLVADRFLGQYRSILIGGLVIAAGHFTLAFKALPAFYAGLAMIVVGTGLLKPNVSTLVGSLYERGDARLDAGFSLFYMGINLGAFLGPLVAGWLAQRVDWHLGFASAGVGMVLGLGQYLRGKRWLQPALDRLAVTADAGARRLTGDGSRGRGLTRAEWTRVGAIVIFFVAATLFWGAYEQAGSTLTFFADRYTRLEVWGVSIPASWFQSIQPIFLILLAPVFAWLWMRLGPREPSVPAKFAFGLFWMGLSFLVLVPAGGAAERLLGTRVSPWWLIGAYLISEIGELCLSPVGLSAVTKLAPARLVGVMMGVWFLSNALGDKLAGWAAGFFGAMPLQSLFGVVAAILLGAAAVMFLLIRPVRRLMAQG